jgi:uncharacterized protein YndB with AHSA1/START domain
MTTGGKTLNLTLPSDTEIRMTRDFDAPRELVFKVYMDPESIPLWWGPARYPTEVVAMDVRPGGAWRFVSRGGDGAEFGFHGEFKEVVPPERMTWTFEFDGAPGHVSVETVSFSERDGVTTVTITSVFASVEDRDAALRSGMESGVVETMDRLAELLRRRMAG